MVRRAAVRSTVWPAPRAPVNMPSSQGDAPCPCEVARVPCRVPPGPGAPTCRLRASVPASVQVESQDACLRVRRRPRSGASSPRFTPQRPAGLPASLLVTAARASLWADACCVPGWCPVFSSRRRERLCRHPRVGGTSCPLGRCRPGARPPGAGVAARPVVRTCQALPPWRARAPQGSPRLPPPLPERSACPCPRGRPLPSRGWCRCAAA